MKSITNARRNKKMSIISLGSPAISVKITEYGTRLAKLEHIWRAARKYAKEYRYKIVETCGVIGIVPF
jgi:hypothetical protein